MTNRLVFLCLLLTAIPLAAGPVNYDIVYVRAPRAGDNTYVRFPDVFYPTAMPSGSDLVLMHPDGSQEVLYAAGKGAVLDPAVSLDAQWVYFSYIPDASSSGINPQRGLAYGGADIYKINLSTRQLIRLTQQVWTPPTGSANWSKDLLSANPSGSIYLGFGTFNLGACPLPGGKVMFVSSRDGYQPNKSYTTPNLRLYIMDDDGRNVEPVGHLNIGSALHPTVLMDGRVMFASFEGQGVRDQRNWGLWAIWPDGRVWEPLMSAFTEGGAFHFQSQLSDGRIAVTDYYNLNDNGFGTILAFNAKPQAGTVPFGSPNANDASNPRVRWGLWDPGVPTAGQPRYASFPFSPQGLINITGFSHGEDRASSIAQDGKYAGKTTHPSGAPGNDMLLVWTSGPANNLNRPTTTPYYDAGIYLLKGGVEVDDYRNLVVVKNDPNYNELHPKAVVPYSAIYGIAQPATLPYLPNDGTLSPLLPAGTPFGLIGTSSFYSRNTTPGFGNSSYGGLDSFNTSQNGESSNWFEQGADAGLYTNADIQAVRIVAMEGVSNRSYPNGGDPGFLNFSEKERLRILGEIPLRKTNGSGQTVLDGQGNPDTSFLAKIPADTPFSFQTIDKNGMVLNMAQTWHMVRPGEVRTNCGGCHAHNKLPLDFNTTAASQAGYPAVDLTTQTPLLTKDAAGNTTVKQAGRLMVDVEYYRDIKPILQRSCVSCHSKSGTPAAGLVLDDTAIVNGYENTYNRLANDWQAQYGIPPVIGNRQWRQTNVSRYVRAFQSRRSLLAWKIFGQRLDGWSNTAHPTESTPGVASTLPSGASADQADIDYTGTIMPPPGSGVPALTEDDKMTIARWIDLGAAISAPDPTYKGYFADEIKPTVALSSPRSGSNPVSEIRIGMFDAYSGIDRTSLSVTTNFVVNGNPAGAELGALFAPVDVSVWRLALPAPISSLTNGHITVRVKDNSGNYTTVDRWFNIGSGGPPPPVPVTVSPAAATLSSGATQQFTAGGGPVTWSLSPTGAGSITTAGFYTAPTVAAQQIVIVTATSSSDTTNFASAMVTVNPAAASTWSISGLIASGAGATVRLTGAASVTTTSNASGAYSFPGLANGQYTVTPTASGFAFTPPSAAVTITGGNVSGVNFNAVASAWTVSGAISPSASGAGVTVRLTGAASVTTTANASGAYSFPGLANGQYTVTPTASGFTFTPPSAAVTINGGNVSGINFNAVTSTWSISGVITSGSGVTMKLTGAATATATANSSGAYSFPGLANGAYKITPSKTGFSFTPSSLAVTVNSGNLTGANFTATAIPVSGISIDAKVWRDQSPASDTVTSPAFSTAQENELLLAFIATDQLTGRNVTVRSVAGGGLNWILVARANQQRGTSEIWRAFSPGRLANVAVRATLSQSVVSSITVLSFAGASAVGASAIASDNSGAPSASLVTTKNNSWVFGVGNDYDRAIARTPAAGQSLIHQYLTPTGDTYWVQMQNTPTPLAGTLARINDIAPVSDRYNLAIVEVVP